MVIPMTRMEAPTWLVSLVGLADALHAQTTITKADRIERRTWPMPREGSQIDEAHELVVPAAQVVMEPGTLVGGLHRSIS
jgi:hypothetical protein